MANLFSSSCSRDAHRLIHERLVSIGARDEIEQLAEQRRRAHLAQAQVQVVRQQSAQRLIVRCAQEPRAESGGVAAQLRAFSGFASQRPARRGEIDARQPGRRIAVEEESRTKRARLAPIWSFRRWTMAV